MNHRVDLLCFRLLKKLHIDSHRACSWPTHTLAVCKCASPLHSYQHLLSLLFVFDDVILIGVRWNLSIALICLSLMVAMFSPHIYCPLMFLLLFMMICSVHLPMCWLDDLIWGWGDAMSFLVVVDVSPLSNVYSRQRFSAILQAVSQLYRLLPLL